MCPGKWRHFERRGVLAPGLGKCGEAADLTAKLRADLTICGPELPLVRGIADESELESALLGPTKAAAHLEGSKVFAKRSMERNGIPTASTYGIYNSPIDAYTSLCSVDWPLVVKADGLCAGKGVLVTSSPDRASEFIDWLMEKKEFGDAGKQILLEEGLSGHELSYIILSDGENFILCRRVYHKRAFDNDEGPNTGGMGAFSTSAICCRQPDKYKILETIISANGWSSKRRARSSRFSSFALMMMDGPKVLNINCRLGTPETTGDFAASRF